MRVAHTQALKGGCPESQSFSLSVDLQIVLTPEEAGPMGKGHSSDEKEAGQSDLELSPRSKEPCPRW